MASSLEPGVGLGGDRVDLPSQGVEPGGDESENTLGSGGCGPLSSNNAGPGEVIEANGRKLLTRRRLLMVEMKKFCSLSRCAKDFEVEGLISKFYEIEARFKNFNGDVETIKDHELVADLLEGVAECFGKCRSRVTQLTRKKFDGTGDGGADLLEPSDSISHAEFYSTASSKISSVSRKIEVKRKRLEMQARRDLELAKAEAAQAKAEAEAAQAKAEVEARFRIEQANLEAEEELISLSGRESSVAIFRRGEERKEVECFPPKGTSAQSGSLVRPSEPVSVHSKNGPGSSGAMRDLNALGSREHAAPKIETGVTLNPNVNPFSPSKALNTMGPVSTDQPGDNMRPCGAFTNVNSESKDCGVNDVSVFKTYLDRQGRNEYLNLASQIGYNGSNIAYVFYENQIRTVMNEAPSDDQRLEALRASCVGQPREMINIFIAPMKSLSTSQRIEMALSRLKQRYGVPGGLTTEPIIVDIRKGPVVSFNVESLKVFNEELNMLEVFAYAHDEYERLSGQLLLDVANRLPGTLKRRYLDYLSRLNLDLNRPSFESLREFIQHELSVVSSDYARTFFRSDGKDKSRGIGDGRGSARVRQVAITAKGRSEKKVAVASGLSVEGKDTQCSRNSRGNRTLPLCFVCNDSVSRHFLNNCSVFNGLSKEDKKQAVINAGRCLNCFSIGHVARKCSLDSKCNVCGPRSVHKHASALHDVFVPLKSDNVGAAVASIDSDVGTGITEGDDASDGSRQISVRKVAPDFSGVLLRTSAVRVINPRTGKSALVYAQHDTGSQATLVSERVKNELGLGVENESVTIRTLADQATKGCGLTNFELQSLSNDEVYSIFDALVVPDFAAEGESLPHAVEVGHLKHFEGVDIPTIPQRNKIDVLIGQSNKELLVVLEEREGACPEDPNYVLTRLGPIASGGKTEGNSKYCLAHKAFVANESPLSVCECERLRSEVSDLKECLSKQGLEDEIIQPSRNEETARNLVESKVKLVEGRYEIPVPLKPDVASNLPDNFHSAANRTATLRKKALKDTRLQKVLIDTFNELINEGWLVPVEESVATGNCWYLPFFMSKQDKPRVVFDGAASVANWYIYIPDFTNLVYFLDRLVGEIMVWYMSLNLV